MEEGHSTTEDFVTSLIYCKANVIAILEAFHKAVQEKKIILSAKEDNCKTDKNYIYINEKYAPLRKNKSTISRVRNNIKKEFYQINRNVFSCMITCLKDHDLLPIQDNSLLYESQPEALYHCKNIFFEISKTAHNEHMKKLAGIYRTFTVSSIKNNNGRPLIMIRNLNIEYIKNGNYLKTTEVYKHNYNDLCHEYECTGIINFLDNNTNRCILEDKINDTTFIRQIYLQKSSPNNNHSSIWEGRVNIMYDDIICNRSYIMHKNPNLKNLNDDLITVPYSDNIIPKQYQKVFQEKNSYLEFKRYLV